MVNNCDYQLSDADASELKGIVLLPADIRRQLLVNYVSDRGQAALLNLFVQFIGAANSVVKNCREMAELLLVCEGTHPHDAEKINMPTLFGAMQGVVLANSCDPTGLCEGCAYRLGTPANQCEATTCDAST